MIHARKDYMRIQDPEKKIPEDEPVFLIRAQDVVGASTLEHYADLLDQVLGDSRISDSVRAQAKAFRAWKKKKKADIPEDVLTAMSEPAAPAKPVAIKPIKPGKGAPAEV